MTVTLRRSLALAGTALLVATLAIAQEQQAPQMSPEEKAMMEAYAKAATPGKQHEWLASKAGSWTFAGTFWMDPSKEPSKSTGTVERSVMLGGRVLAEKVKSSGFMGQPFEGYGLTGYDNVTGEFWGTWNDNMGTGLMTSTGTCDDKGVCTQNGEYVDPLTGKKRTSRMTSRDEGPDKEVHEAFEKGPDGKEFKTMEIVYTRKK
jgi:Protein of unknown function (DUF1579)